MKLFRMLALVLTMLLCLVPAMAESSSRIDELAGNIIDEIWFGKYPHDMITVWMDDYTVAEWEAAAIKAVKDYRELEQKGDTMFPMPKALESYLDGSFFESEEYLSILAEYGLSRSDRDLGDESIPLYALCAAAVVALGGAVYAGRKRVHA